MLTRPCLPLLSLYFNADTSNRLYDEERGNNFHHILAPKGVANAPKGQQDGFVDGLMEAVSPASVLVPLDALVAAALADDAERRSRKDDGLASSSSSSSSSPWAANPIDVVLVAYNILLKTLSHERGEVADAIHAASATCSKTITVVVAGEGEAEFEEGKAKVDDGFCAVAALLLQGIGCKLRIILVDPEPVMRARGAAKKEEKGIGGRANSAAAESDSDDGEKQPPPLRLPAALEALVAALPRGQGLVRVQRASGAVGLSAALMEASPPATTWWKGPLELARVLSAGDGSAAAAPGAAGGGDDDGKAPVSAPPPPLSEACIPVKVNLCVTRPEVPKWVPVTEAGGGGIRLKKQIEYRRRSPMLTLGAGEGGEGGEDGEGGEGEGGRELSRGAKMAKVDAGAARLAPVFEVFDDNDDDDDGRNNINNKEALVAAGLFDKRIKNTDSNVTTRSLSPEAVSKEEMTAAYRYGHEIVPLSADLKKHACKLPASTITKSMVLLGFASPPPLHAIESGAWVMTAGGAPSAKKPTKANPTGGTSVAAADSHAAEALSALARACHKNEKVMVVRWVKTAEGDPRLYAGFPVLGEEIDDEGKGGKGKWREEGGVEEEGKKGKGRKEGVVGDEKKMDLDALDDDDGRGRGHRSRLDDEFNDVPNGGNGTKHHHHSTSCRPRLSSPDCFVLVALPFAEDVRRVKFPPLDADVDRLPMKHQVEAAKEYVRAWDLSGTGLFARAALDGSEGTRRRKGGENFIVGGAHPHLSRLRQLACAAAKTVAVINEQGDNYEAPEVGSGPATGLLEPPAWPEGSRADAAARGLAEAFASAP